MYEEKLKVYDAIIEKCHGIDRKGKTMPYTSANGYMFSQVNKRGELGIRLSKEDTFDFDSNYGAKPFLSYGATMREYVLIPESLLSQKEILAEILQKGYEYVRSLPPK